MRAVTGKPIKFVSTGEKLDEFEHFHPDRMAQPHPGHGRRALSDREGAGVARREAGGRDGGASLRRAEFTFDDFLQNIKQVRKMGSLSSIVGMLPGASSMKQLKDVQVDDGQLDRIEAIDLLDDGEERRHPDSSDGSRRQRIARGSGMKVQDVNQLMKQYREMQKLLRMFSSGKMKGRGFRASAAERVVSCTSTEVRKCSDPAALGGRACEDSRGGDSDKWQYE